MATGDETSTAPTTTESAAPAAAPRKRASRRVTTAAAAPPSEDSAAAPVRAARATRTTKTARPAKAAKTAAAAEPSNPPTPEAAESPAKPAKTAKATKASKTAKATKAPKQPKATKGKAADGAGDDHGAVEPRSSSEAAPAVATLGVLFQPADLPPAPTRRRASRATSAPAATPEAEAKATGDSQPEGRRAEGRSTASKTEDAAAEPSSAPTTGPAGDGGESDASGTSRRRRRGGRGRRGRTLDAADESADTSANNGAERSAAPIADEADSEADEAGSRRRRRRRRSGGATEGDDPPGTVTRVREARPATSTVTGVKGSTRLEAKKQRRREGREAGRRRTIITEAEFLARRESVERVMVVREHAGRTQIAVLEDNVLVEHYVSRESNQSMAGNIYLGRVQNVLPSMEAAFVDIGRGRNAVLYAGEVNWDAAGLEVNAAKRIENALTSGDSVLVQVTKDPIGHKGARLTSQISLPGRFLVYVPEGSMTGISRKLPDTERARLKAILKEIVPDSAGVIVRTAAEGASEEELRADVERLTQTWDRIKAKADTAASRKSGSGGAPVLLHGEPDLTVRVIRDIFNEDFASLVVAGSNAVAQVNDYVAEVAPDLAARVSTWTEETDVFTRYRVHEQLAKAMDRKVWLPSGGSLVIDRTEAMTVVDVNTGKFVGSGGNLEETVTKNNIEAAEEIVRQLRLRDIGGIIVIDFIDMVLESNRDLVVRRLLECLGRDRTKHQVAEVTSLGLVQMTRKRVGSGLIEVFSEPCEHCNGRGLIVHAEPIERPIEPAPPSHSSAPRRGRPEPQPQRAPEPHVSHGPTAAQIAAAAHAAAVKAVETPVDATEEAVSAESAESEVATGAEVVIEPMADLLVVVEAAPPTELADEGPAAPEPAPAPEAPQASAPAPRRRRGRVVAPAGPPRHTTEQSDSEPAAAGE